MRKTPFEQAEAALRRIVDLIPAALAHEDINRDLSILQWAVGELQHTERTFKEIESRLLWHRRDESFFDRFENKD